MKNVRTKKRRVRTRQRKAEARRREHDRAVFSGKLRTLALAALLTLVGGGIVFDGTTYFTSPADGALDVFAELSQAEFVTIPDQSEEELRGRWEKLDAIQRRLHRNIATELRVSPAIPAVSAGTSAAEIAPRRNRALVPVGQQLEQRELASETVKQALQRRETRRAAARSATF